LGVVSAVFGKGTREPKIHQRQQNHLQISMTVVPVPFRLVEVSCADPICFHFVSLSIIAHSFSQLSVRRPSLLTGKAVQLRKCSVHSPSLHCPHRQ
ncbi:hypothetical protein KCU85_g48, partial [Aureobasidium melanogenum]